MDLKQLWKSRLDVLLANLATGEQEYREIGHAAEHMTADYHGRFLIELLQNASDQVLRGRPSKVLIVVTPKFLAIFNQGEPFSPEGLQAITSIMLSPKDPSECIGNKGIGFKSVFEITDAPEIYGVGRSRQGLSSGAALRLCLGRRLSENAEHLAQLEDMAKERLAKSRTLAANMRQRHGERIMAVVRTALMQSAPFKYPTAIPKGQLMERLEALGVTREEASSFQTLVVLPRLKGSIGSVQEALKTLIADAHGLMAFLPAITHIELRTSNSKRNERFLFEREDFGSRVHGSVTFIERKTSFQRLEDSRPTWADGGPTFAVVEQSTRRWWLVTKVWGTSVEEREILKAAAASLPGDAQRSMKSAPVSVALPWPSEHDLSLDANGRFTVGLPTEVLTGTPFWVHGHFHANLSRTGIDFDSQPWNRALLDEAFGLVKILLEDLKGRREPLLEEVSLPKLAVALAFATDYSSVRYRESDSEDDGPSGPLARLLHHAETGLAGTDIILGRNGQQFHRAVCLVLPRCSWAAWLLKLDAQVSGPSLEDAGYCLSHPLLMEHRYDLLETLNKHVDGDKTQPRFCMSEDGQISLLERWAECLVAQDDTDWASILRWCAEHIRPHVQNLRILPCRGGRLASPSDSVYMPLLEEGCEDEPAAATLGILDIPLNILVPDIFVRETDGSLTRLGQILCGISCASTGSWKRSAEQVEDPLLARPTYDKLLTGAVSAAMESALASEDEEMLWRLFAVALRWTVAYARDSRQPLPGLFVPVADAAWRPAVSVVLGEGLVEQHDAPLLERLLSKMADRGVIERTVGWSELGSRSELEGLRKSEVGEALRQWGVSAGLLFQFLKPIPVDAPAKLLTEELPGYTLERWERYLAGWNDGYSSRLPRDASLSPLWLCGLDDAELVQDVLHWVLVKGRVSESERTEGEGTRTYFGDKPIPAWWIQAAAEWASCHPAIPTSETSWTRGGLALSSHVCIVSPNDQQQVEALALIPQPRADLDVQFLLQFGVPELKDADFGQLSRLLQQLAIHWNDRVEHCSTEESGLKVVMTELYTRLSNSVRYSGQPLPEPGSLWPVLRGDRLGVLVVGAEPTLYFEDDPYPTCFIPGYESSAHLSVPRGTNWTLLMNWFDGIDGLDAIRTSEAAIQPPFEVRFEGGPLLPWLQGESLPRVTVRELAFLVAFIRGDSEVHIPQREAWQRLLDAQISFGHFDQDSTAFYDRSKGFLLLDLGLQGQPEEVLVESWAVLGISYQAHWEVACRRLIRGQEAYERLLHQYKLTDHDRARAAHALGLTQSPQASPGYVDGDEGREGIAIQRSKPVNSSAAEAIGLSGTVPVQHPLVPAHGMPTVRLLGIHRKRSDVEQDALGARALLATVEDNPLTDTGLGGILVAADGDKVGGDWEDDTQWASGGVPLEFGAPQGDPDAATGDALESDRPIQAHASVEADVTRLDSSPRTPPVLVVPSPTSAGRGGGVFGQYMGLLGEAFALRQLSAWLPDFSEVNWISKPEPGSWGSRQADAGFDFRYLDHSGVLSGAGATECCIEVKSALSPEAGRLEITNRQWASARRCHMERGRMYFLLSVVNLAGTPRVAQLIRDPFGLYITGRLRMRARRLQVWTLADASESDELDHDPESVARTSRTRPHTGVKFDYVWSSRKGYSYTWTRWSCCGHLAAPGPCPRVPGLYHPGKLYGGGSRRSGGGGMAFWSCCGKLSTTPGCSDEGMVVGAEPRRY